jgi:hypothetical protein
VIGVDDAHDLDEVSASLLHQLVLRNTAAVILTLRTGRSAPDAVTALWKDGLLRRRELRSLSLEETAELVQLVLGDRLDSMAASRFWVMSGGNPLYLRLLVEGEREAGRLTRIAGVWQWAGRPAVSAGLVELVRQRIGHLSESQREVLEYLALSEPIGVSLLTGLTDAGALEQLEARGIVEVSRTDGGCGPGWRTRSTARSSARSWGCCGPAGSAAGWRGRSRRPGTGGTATRCAGRCWRSHRTGRPVRGCSWPGPSRPRSGSTWS